MTEHEGQQQSQPADEREAEDLPEEPGAEGGSRSPAADKPPGMPADDDSPVGDTDQHSSEATE
ncbi:MAG: hypothetical protein JO321_04455 [Solirubrobacterales bacterium]|nr:hypothetical protein [Solirubrobacterales bacterium]MBV9166022.1 hypothetical protein [Solirubrobacterales bacterium]MBV9534649.1 hypothetical protein [Solirubrobacterales bacterium]